MGVAGCNNNNRVLKLHFCGLLHHFFSNSQQLFWYLPQFRYKIVLTLFDMGGGMMFKCF